MKQPRLHHATLDNHFFFHIQHMQKCALMLIIIALTYRSYLKVYLQLESILHLKSIYYLMPILQISNVKIQQIFCSQNYKDLKFVQVQKFFVLDIQRLKLTQIFKYKLGHRVKHPINLKTYISISFHLFYTFALRNNTTTQTQQINLNSKLNLDSQSKSSQKKRHAPFIKVIRAFKIYKSIQKYDSYSNLGYQLYMKFARKIIQENRIKNSIDINIAFYQTNYCLEINRLVSITVKI
eukprot:TRINITY_DN5728_c1_g1_i2.p1 TRINITY_DN5728_c1_g1~~TRINITY_DN5728_c1_g1_i2.p1  ORF type:complete len:237 (+),score=-22.42 TRINITY_DN5728_c1_g1_i2:724-1434(+)